jgi:uncharacterized protein (TIGR02270 family)
MPALVSASLKDPYPIVRARALKACGELGRVEMLPAVAAQLDSSEEGCRFWATWSSLLLGRTASKTEIIAWANRPGPFRIKAVSLAMRTMPVAEALAWLDSLGEDDTRLRFAALGWVGAASRASWLVQITRQPALARRAGAALTWITGVEFRTGELGHLPPPDLEEELAEAGLADPTDNDLAWPDPDKTEAWWKQVGHKFDPAKAYLLGRPKGESAFRDALMEGRQCHRSGAALELALLNPGQPLPEIRAPART